MGNILLYALLVISVARTGYLGGQWFLAMELVLSWRYRISIFNQT